MFTFAVHISDRYGRYVGRILVDAIFAHEANRIAEHIRPLHVADWAQVIGRIPEPSTVVSPV